MYSMQTDSQVLRAVEEFLCQAYADGNDVVSVLDVATVIGMNYDEDTGTLYGR